MMDPLPVKYEVVENLFCQRKVETQTEPEKKKEPTVVNDVTSFIDTFLWLIQIAL